MSRIIAVLYVIATFCCCTESQHLQQRRRVLTPISLPTRPLSDADLLAAVINSPFWGRCGTRNYPKTYFYCEDGLLLSCLDACSDAIRCKDKCPYWYHCSYFGDEKVDINCHQHYRYPAKHSDQTTHPTTEHVSTPAPAQEIETPPAQLCIDRKDHDPVTSYQVTVVVLAAVILMLFLGIALSLVFPDYIPDPIARLVRRQLDAQQNAPAGSATAGCGDSIDAPLSVDASTCPLMERQRRHSSSGS